MSGKNCQICGKPSGMYPLCKEHLALKNEGKVIKNEKTGEWELKDLSKDEYGECKINKKCLLCSNSTENGNLFCKEHYFKYKDKTITVTIKNLTDFNIVDEYGNRDVKTANGMYVRSQQEKIIYDELYSRGVKFEYEKTAFYKDENGEVKELHPDFYLTDYNLYIEHWGYENTKDKKYISEKAYKEKIYKELGVKIAGTSSEDIKDIGKAIDRIFFENNIVIPKNKKE